MIYFQDSRGYVYCYDDSKAITLIYKFYRWKISKETYFSIRSKSQITRLSEDMAKELTNHADVNDILDLYTLNEVEF